MSTTRSNLLRDVKFRRKTIFFAYSDHHLQFRNSKNNEPFHFGSCGESFSHFQLRPIFARQTNRAHFHTKHTCKPQIIVRITLKKLNKVLKVFVFSISIYLLQKTCIFCRLELPCKLRIYNDCKSAHFLGRCDRSVQGCSFGFVISV